MSRFDAMASEIRASAEYCPPCPLCSHLQVDGFPDQIIGPSLWGKDGRCGLSRCCRLSETDARFETRAQAAAWWRAARLKPHPDLAMANRQASTLARLEEAGLGPIEPQPEQPSAGADKWDEAAMERKLGL